MGCCSAIRPVPLWISACCPPTNVLLCQNKAPPIWRDLAPGEPDALPPMEPMRRLYFLLWTMFMVFTGMMFVMVSQLFRPAVSWKKNATDPRRYSR